MWGFDTVLKAKAEVKLLYVAVERWPWTGPIPDNNMQTMSEGSAQN